jgi:hypothetical protein
MRNIKYIITIAALFIFIQSCYTIIRKTNVEHNYSSNSQFPENSGLNSRLTGDWINKKLWTDYGYQIRKLEIKDNGSVIGIPDSERSSSKIYYGSYRILSDTLIIKFDWEDRTE